MEIPWNKLSNECKSSMPENQLVRDCSKFYNTIKRAMFEMIHAEIESTIESEQVSTSFNEEEQFDNQGQQETQNEQERFETPENFTPHYDCPEEYTRSYIKQTNQQYTDKPKQYIPSEIENYKRRNYKQTLMDEYMYKKNSQPRQNYSPSQDPDMQFTSQQFIEYDDESANNEYLNEDIQPQHEEDYLLDNEGTIEEYSNYELEQESPSAKRWKSTHFSSPNSSYNYLHRPTLEERILHYNTLHDKSELWKEYSIHCTPKRITTTPPLTSPQFFHRFSPHQENLSFEKNLRSPLYFNNVISPSESIRKSPFMLDFSTPSRASTTRQFSFLKHANKSGYPAISRGTKRKLYHSEVCKFLTN
jgi:hypothetical protein